ncbi:glycosyltransferase family 4 protein [Rhodopila globiformis]|uniref:Glycosyl transferase n=1 Tax=Rhodopila globiformis TaxID=1071 RepID=A0A2S6NFS9_RHOGL|nr:glycosyltransferase family 4 protein [Rhodopila globiformis]PPQ33488.1 glycosyl transferase [Rhodopila globiformis]
MRIAQIAPLYEAVPPKLYGGTERVVSFLTEELVALGHNVTLFASGDSVTAAELESVIPRALRLDPSIRDLLAPQMLLMEAVRRRADEFDILHFHLDYLPFSLFSRQQTPFVTTLHGRLDLPELKPMFKAFPDVSVVSISDSQREPLPGARYVGTVHHGLPAGLLLPQQRAKPDYLAFLGRIAPEKGPDSAIRIARACGIPLKIAAKVDRADQSWFDAVIRPLLQDGGVEMVGEISDDRKAAFLSGAVALLMPIAWPEPFGLVMIEAMACGTPVIAFNRGSVPEIIDDGVSGYIVEDEAGAIAAVSSLVRLSRNTVRASFMARFTARRMAQDYLTIYRKLARQHGAADVALAQAAD